MTDERSGGEGGAGGAGVPGGRRGLLDGAEAVLEVGRATASILDPKEVVNRALDVVSRYHPLPVQFAVFGDPDEAGAWKLLGARSPDPAKLKELEGVVLSKEDLGVERARALETGEASFVSDVQQEPTMCGRLGTTFGVRSLLTVPLRSGDETLGMFLVCSPQPGHQFSEAERVLLRGVADQVSISIRNARLQRENLRALEDLRALSRRLWTVQEEERERIARELHDEAGQAMTALKLNLDLARRDEDLQRVKTRIADAVELAGNVLDELRRITSDLRPGGLHELGLVPALRALVDGFAKRAGVDAAFESSSDVVPHPDSDIASTSFRFIQEALTNVARHAQATKVRVSLEPGTSAGRIRLVVEDDGIGFQPKAALDGHFGLVGMRERARMLGGSLRVDTSAGRGTRLALELPAALGKSS